MDPDLSDRIAASMPWLEEVSARIRETLDPVLGQDGPRAVRDALDGVWLGHPLHPALVTMPVGCWTAAAVFDLLGEERAADLSIGLGLVGAVGAAATGAAQFQDAGIEPKVQRIGALHALLNTGATLLYAGSLLARRNGNRTGGVALSTAGLAVSTASAWLGGELAYDLGIGPNRTAFGRPAAEWTDVAAEADLVEGKPLRVTSGDLPVLLVRDGGEIEAIGAVCSHLGGPLDEGEIADGCVTCPWHGSVFRLADGRVVHSPATHPQPLFETRVANGRVEIRPAFAEVVALPADRDGKESGSADRVLSIGHQENGAATPD